MHSIGSPKFEPFVKKKTKQTSNILKKEKKKANTECSSGTCFITNSYDQCNKQGEVESRL